MKPGILRFFSPLACCVLWSAAFAQSPVRVTVDPRHPGAAVPADFSGLSFETSLLLPDAAGTHYFRPDNAALIRLFHELGIKSLRIGGNTSDRNLARLPSEADIDSLFGFAKAADVKVIYCLRLYGGDPQADAATAKYILDRYAPQVESFSIGQEPSAYPVTPGPDARPALERMGAAVEHYPYEAYREQWKKFADAILAAAPGARFCGPSIHDDAAWAKRFLDDFGRRYPIAMITEHLYPGGAGGKVPTPESGRARILSAGFSAEYQRLYDGLAPLAASSGLPYRLEETNSYYNGGAAGVSDAFAAALWGLDYLYWWAAHGAAGLNFHTGDHVAAGPNLQVSRYAAFVSDAGGYAVRPIGYGIKAFDLGSRGSLLPVTLSNPKRVDMTAYAVLAADSSIYITLINKENGHGARSAQATIDAGSSYKGGRVLFLSADSVAASSGVTLGGAEIRTDGTWDGKWTALAASGKDAGVAVVIPSSSAAIVELSSASR